MNPTEMRSMPAAASRPLVLVVDDDAALREALGALFRSVDLDAEFFGSTAELLARTPPDGESCLVLDIRLPGGSGLEFQARIAELFCDIPVVFLTGYGDIPMTVRAMKAGAVDFLAKPFEEQDLLDAVGAALGRDRARRAAMAETAVLQRHFQSLTSREREIFRLVVTGLMNKQIAGEIGLSEITVKVHRGNVMKKMQARSVADLVRMAEALAAHVTAEPPYTSV